MTNCARGPIIFVIDDEDAICDIVIRAFAKLGIETRKFHTAKAAFAELENVTFGAPLCKPFSVADLGAIADGLLAAVTGA